MKSVFIFLFIKCFFMYQQSGFLNSEVLFHIEKENNNVHAICNNQNYIILSTIDGGITAIDMNSGEICWTVLLDKQKFLSSSLSQLQITENGKRIWLIPSLDGTLFKYDTFKLEPLPVDSDYLINNDEFASIAGGKLKIIYGVHRKTGEIIYTCKIEGCFISSSTDPENMLVVEETVYLVNAVDSSKALKKWHFRVVELKIKLPVKMSSRTTFHPDIVDKKALLLSTYVEDNNFDLYKISLKNQLIGMIDRTTKKFSWFLKTYAPITDAWYLKDNFIKILDPLDPAFFPVEMNDGKYIAYLFLGTYENQMYIKKSKKLQMKAGNMSSLSLRVLHQSFSFPVCLQSDPLNTPSDSNNTALIPSVLNTNDYSSYFYINMSISIIENSTHCIVNTSYNSYDKKIENSYWFNLYIIVLFATVLLMLTTVLQIFYDKKKECFYVNSPSVEISLPADVHTRNVDLQFNSRFLQDFEMRQILGKGGFGVVMDVRNKIDDCNYAVKRIRLHEKLSSAQYEKVLREVKALAKLDHHGIVRYFNAWIEYPPAGWQEKRDKELNIWSTPETSIDLSFSSTNSSVESKPNTSKLLQKLYENPLVLGLCNEDDFSLHKNDNHYNEYEDSFENSYGSSVLFGSGDFKASASSSSSTTLDEYKNISSNSNNFVLPCKNRTLLNAGGSDQPLCYKKINKSCSYSFLKSFDGEKENSCKRMSSDHRKYVENSSFFETPISKQNSSFFVVLKNLNDILLFPLSKEVFQEICKHLSNNVISTDSVIKRSDWENFIATYFFYQNKLLNLQQWLICILCMIRSSKLHYSNLLISNLCYILWDVNSRLKDCSKQKPSKSMSERSNESSFYSKGSNYDQESCYNKYSNSSEVTKSDTFPLSTKNSPSKVIPGYLYIQMQLCKKESLRDWLNHNSTDRVYKKILEIFYQIVEAVNYVHSCGLMHRDLKPSNIYFSMEDTIKIGDFGLATSSDIEKDVCDENPNLSYFHTSDIGTEFYMSPEQKRKQNYDSKTDIYSLGIIFFELLIPFKTHSERFQVLTNVRKLKFPDSFREKYKGEHELIQMMLNADPNRRPSSTEIKNNPLISKYSTNESL